MKFFISIILTALLAFVLCLRFEWFMVAVAAFVVALAIPQKPAKALLAGFLGIFLLWATLAFLIKNQGGDIIAGQVAELMPLGGSKLLLILVTALVGGLAGGAAALTGSLGRKLVK
jgi:hypothetical protein